jgi:hypothetical protein
MLIADTQNSRILVAKDKSQVRTLIDRRGNKPGEIQHPIAFCTIVGDSDIYVLEIRNHRFQRFGIEGQTRGCTGGEGLGRGQLILPESIATFDDGMIAVSQRACTRVLKLFSAKGDELDALHVNYHPWGILAHKTTLFVCEAFSDYLHVYERI